MGTPITGRVVCAATAPAKCAAPPAPQMKTFVPVRAASLTNVAVCSGVRCAGHAHSHAQAERLQHVGGRFHGGQIGLRPHQDRNVAVISLIVFLACPMSCGSAFQAR
jgi:hypothetical protein